LDYGCSTSLTVSLEGITDTRAAGIHEFRTTNLYRAHAQAPTIPIVLHVCREQPAQKTNDFQCPCPTQHPFRESALADKVMRNRNGQEYFAPEVTGVMVAAYPDLFARTEAHRLEPVLPRWTVGRCVDPWVPQQQIRPID
jgi:hypothetical protein